MKQTILKISIFVISILIGFGGTSTVYAENLEPTIGARTLAITLAPVDANNTDYDHDLVEVVGDTVKLLQDINLNKNKTFAREATLDLAGHTLNMGNGRFTLTASGENVANLTITGESGSLFTSNGSSTAQTLLYVNKKATLTVEGEVRIESVSSVPAILLATAGTVDVNSGTIIGAQGNAIQSQGGGTVIVNGGMIEGESNGINALSNSTVKIYGGTISGNINGIYASSGTITNISGGTIKSESGYGIALLGEAPSLTVTNGNIIGASALTTTGSQTTNAAISINGGTFTGTSSAAMYLAGTGKTVIDNGSITGKAGIVVRGGALEVNGGTITATGNGNLSVGDSGTTVPANALVVDDLENYDLVGVTVNNGNFVGDTSFINSKEGNDKVIENAKLVITGGAFSTDIKDYVEDGKVSIRVKTNDDTTYYVGNNAVKSVLNAKKGTAINVLKGNLEVSNVAGGVKVTNSGNGIVKINNREITSADDEVTIIDYNEKIDTLREVLEHYIGLLDGSSEIDFSEINARLKYIKSQIDELKSGNLNDDQKTIVSELLNMLEAARLKLSELENLQKPSTTPSDNTGTTNNAQTSSMNINFNNILSILSLTGIGYILYSKKRGEI